MELLEPVGEGERGGEGEGGEGRGERGERGWKGERGKPRGEDKGRGIDPNEILGGQAKLLFRRGARYFQWPLKMNPQVLTTLNSYYIQVFSACLSDYRHSLTG